MTMKKILILNGAGKKNGNTAALIKAFTEGAASAGNEVKEFYLQTMTIRGCLDCQGCKRKQKGDPHPCVQKDDMDGSDQCDYKVHAELVWYDPDYETMVGIAKDDQGNGKQFSFVSEIEKFDAFLEAVN